MLPLGQLVQDPEKVDAGKHVPPAKWRSVPDLQSFSSQFWLFTNDARWEIQESNAENVNIDCH